MVVRVRKYRREGYKVKAHTVKEHTRKDRRSSGRKRTTKKVVVKSDKTPITRPVIDTPEIKPVISIDAMNPVDKRKYIAQEMAKKEEEDKQKIRAYEKEQRVIKAKDEENEKQRKKDLEERLTDYNFDTSKTVTQMLEDEERSGRPIYSADILRTIEVNMRKGTIPYYSKVEDEYYDYKKLVATYHKYHNTGYGHTKDQFKKLEHATNEKEEYERRWKEQGLTKRRQYEFQVMEKLSREREEEEEKEFLQGEKDRVVSGKSRRYNYR